TPGRSRAGGGGVPSGILTARMARGMPPYDAARLGVHLHGSSGDLAAAELGQESLIASDLIRFLPAAIRQHPTAS
ncbi:MAG: bifunctional ADP-dependent NAD(P)H-hydrate dehydratase/NAD(P)H-hydrate epimerase, partial [Planctomycetes bacterium]|nr:bifunctional ADP-dependent NAD(P)H-hydrate dehydratase/NAD(P)H-hydrate epimerase [Planctomycetota bacterium]